MRLIKTGKVILLIEPNYSSTGNGVCVRVSPNPKKREREKGHSVPGYRTLITAESRVGRAEQYKFIPGALLHRAVTEWM